MTGTATRAHIVDAADRLFYEQGFEHTTFSDIAGVVQISRGNFYYHFKTKDEILDAVVDLRLARTREMLEHWDAETDDPAERILCFVRILMVNRADIKRFGCPVGTLCTELAKLHHASLRHAKRLFTMFRTWLRRQFELLGCGADADVLAMHLLARSQGVATLANALHDQAFVEHEVLQMRDWVTRIARADGKHA